MKGTIDLKKHNFAIGSKGRFEGEIQAKKVSISGEMNGSIKAQGAIYASMRDGKFSPVDARDIAAVAVKPAISAAYTFGIY